MTHDAVKTWEADIDLCLGCHALDTTADRLRASKGSHNGLRPTLFHVTNTVEVPTDG